MELERRNGVLIVGDSEDHGRAVALPLGHLEPAHAGHREVQQHEVRGSRRSGEAGRSILRLTHDARIRELLREAAEFLPAQLLVVGDDQGRSWRVDAGFPAGPRKPGGVSNYSLTGSAAGRLRRRGRDLGRDVRRRDGEGVRGLGRLGEQPGADGTGQGRVTSPGRRRARRARARGSDRSADPRRSDRPRGTRPRRYAGPPC